MTQSPESYGKALFELGADYDNVMQCRNIMAENPILIQVLCNELVKKEEKFNILDRLFNKQISNFLKYLCGNDCCDSVFDIFLEFEECYLKSKNIAKATLTYAYLPDEGQINQMKKILCDKLGTKDVFVEPIQDFSIIGGCVLQSGSYVFDKSVKGALQGLKRKLIMSR